MTHRAIYRKHAAELARSIRAMWPGLLGNWTRRDWNQQASAAAHNYITRMERMERANPGFTVTVKEEA